MLAIPTTTALIERLAVDRALRQICGWERRAQVPRKQRSLAPSPSSRRALPERMHEALVDVVICGRIVGQISRDATEIEAREKPTPKEADDNKDDPPPGLTAAQARTSAQGRATAEALAARIERQSSQTIDQMRAALPTQCDVGSKKNSKGYKETWIGYKLHIDAANGNVPVACDAHRRFHP